MIYLDNAATSWPKPEAVYQSMDSFMRQVGASPGRSAHRLSIEAGRTVYETRESLAQLFGGDDPKRIVFSHNATAALNLVIRGILHPGDHVVTSSMEHNSMMRPLRAMEKKGVEITVVNCSAEGFLDPQDMERAIKPNTKLITLNHASNVVGTIQPLAEVGQIARRHEIPFLVDAAQTAGCYPIDVKVMNIDLLVFSGHKGLYGPQGVGGLYLGKGMEHQVEPLTYGGTGSHSEYEYQPDFLPDKYESGTPNTVGLAGLGAGVRFVLYQEVNVIQRKEETLTQSLLHGLRAITGVTLYGNSNAQKQVAVISFNIFGLTSSEVAAQLEEGYQIMCRAGLHCSPATHRTIGTFPQGTVRLSPGYFTSQKDIEITLEAVQNIAAGKRRC